MSSDQDLLARNSTTVIAIAPLQTVLEAVRRMNETGFGRLVVLENNQLAGDSNRRYRVYRTVVALCCAGGKQDAHLKSSVVQSPVEVSALTRHARRGSSKDGWRPAFRSA
jgi:CBS domain-containing protein